MRLSVAVAGHDAPPDAFVVWRGFERSVEKAAQLGFHGIELALKEAADVDARELAAALSSHGLEASCISTGQVFAVLGLYFTHPDESVRRRTRQVFEGLIDLAQDFGRLINVGRARGYYTAGQPPEQTERLFIETCRTLCDYAALVKYVHFADSNRLAPGQGHLDFDDVLRGLKRGGFDGWVSIEILPKPDPDTAARQSAAAVLPMVERYNRGEV